MGADPEVLRAPRHLERRMFLLMLPAFSAACLGVWALNSISGMDIWFDRLVLIPGAASFLVLFLLLYRKRTAGLRIVRIATLMIGPGIVLSRLAVMLVHFSVHGYDDAYNAPMAPWLMIAMGLFVFMLPRPQSSHTGGIYLILALGKVALFLQTSRHQLPPVLLKDFYLSYFVAMPVFFVVMLAFAHLRHEYGRARARAEDHESLALFDSLTGLGNRRAFRAAVKRAQARQRRGRAPLSVVIIDLDHFKKLNDTYGHLAGDDVLVGVGKLMTEQLRGSDELFRVGGEEFIALLNDTPLEGATATAERLHLALLSARLLDDVRVTASFGVTEVMNGETIELFYKRADEALYQAKQEGRNRVVTRPPPDHELMDAATRVIQANLTE
jgi:diguanylate cyclase (GGDEF)-like protein